MNDVKYMVGGIVFGGLAITAFAQKNYGMCVVFCIVVCGLLSD